MQIICECNICGRRHHLDDTLAGKAVKCGCGELFVVPTHEEILEGSIQNTVEKVNPFRFPFQGMIEKLFDRSDSSRWQILMAILVGAAFGISGAAKAREEPSLGGIVIYTLGGALLGAIAGLLLDYSGRVTKRKSAGQHVPLVVDLYFGKRWLSIIMWIVTAFVGAFSFVLYLELTS